MSKQSSSDKVVALYKVEGFTEWLYTNNLNISSTSFSGNITISTDDPWYNLVGVIDEYFVTSMEPHILMAFIKHIVSAYQNGMYKGKEVGARIVQNAVRTTLGFEEIDAN